MHFVAVKTREQQARRMLFRTRDPLVRQRTQTINALRGHFAEFGVIAPGGGGGGEPMWSGWRRRLKMRTRGCRSRFGSYARLFVQVADLDQKDRRAG